MNTGRWSALAPLLGRILMGGFFLWRSLQEATNFSATSESIMHLGIPTSSAALWAALAIVLEAVGGLALIVGARTRMAALGLALYLALTSLAFSGASAGAAGSQIFIENLAVVGGLLVLSAFKRYRAV